MHVCTGNDKAGKYKKIKLQLFDPVFIQYRQEEHCTALIQIYQVAAYYVESVQTILV
jgi:hypothetical protein